jgi:proline iminopeptidase
MREGLKIVGRKVHALYEPLEPYQSGYLSLGHGHEMYYEQCGRADGVPVLFLHGGPGAGASPAHRQFFDPTFYRTVIFDQRGAGRSRPLASLIENHTQALIADIERLRQHLNVERWIVFGGSWGSTLALAYAISHPQAVRALVLRGVFLGRASEIDWFLHRIGLFRPEAWRAFTEFLPTAERGDILGSYYRRLTDPASDVHMPAARAWSSYESVCSTLLPSADQVAGSASDRLALGLARIEAHYFVHRLFLPDDYFLRNLPSIRHLPCAIVQGRYDLVCPPVTAFDLAAAWPEAELIVAPDAGHSAFEASIRSELIGVMERLKGSVL